MTIFKELFQNQGIRRFLVLVILVLFLLAFKSMLNMMLITFIIAYLMNRISTYLTGRLQNVIRVGQRAVAVGLCIPADADVNRHLLLYSEAGCRVAGTGPTIDIIL